MDCTEKYQKFFSEFEKISPRRPMVNITPYRGDTTVFSSKFGGVPYFPKNMKYPTVEEGEFEGLPIRFLAQLNFAEIPQLQGFPASGILQFFVGCNGHDTYGMDFDDPMSQNTFRILYHENIITEESQLYTEEDMPAFDETDYPFEGEFALEFSEAEPSLVPIEDYRFSGYACEAYNKAFGKKVKSLFGEDGIETDDPEFFDLLCDSGYDPEDDDEELMDRICCEGAHIGGYPYFTQLDPREDSADYQRYDTLLLQIDTEDVDEDEIMWGDSGVANFFIAAEDLVKKDFSRVMYNWDCC